MLCTRHLHCKERTPSAHVAPGRGIATKHAPQAAAIGMVETALFTLQLCRLELALLPNVRSGLNPHWQGTELRLAENGRVAQVEDVPGRDRAKGLGWVHTAELVKRRGAVAVKTSACTAVP